MKRAYLSGFLFFSTLLFVGCGPKQVEMVRLSEASLSERQMETRKFETRNTTSILSVGVATLQDLGFHIDEVNRDFGLITASKTRDAREIGEQIGFFVLSLFGGANAMLLADHTQTIRATLVVIPKKNESYARLTLQRIIYNGTGQVSSTEIVKDGEIYKEFFEKLSKGIFLEENK